MNKQIIVEVDTEGGTTVDAQGYQGESCQEATAFLEKALGRSVTQRLKPDYWRQKLNNKAQNTVRTGGE